MGTVLAGYEESDSSKGSSLTEVTTSSISDANKNCLDVANQGEVDLVNNPAHSWVITRSDLQPDSETVVLSNSNTYTRTFTYNASGAMTARSAWVKQ